MTNPRTSVLFLIRSLEMGGAERQLTTLARGLDPELFKTTVLCFYKIGPFVRTLENAGIDVVSLEKKGRWDVVGFCARLVGEVRQRRPNVIHSFMGPPNLLATLLEGFWPKTRIVWGIRSSDMDFGHYDFTWRVTFELERRLSRRPDAIVANSFAGRNHALEKGFCADRFIVVPNGVAADSFEVAADEGRQVRESWGIDPSHTLIGLVGRLDAKKDHNGFLKAAAEIARKKSEVRFVVIGGDGRVSRDELVRLTQTLGIAESVVWAGPRDDMAAVYAALDVHCSASAFGEGFPNVVAEAMAAGVPNVVTDVGDSARIIGDYGVVVPPGQPVALAKGLESVLDLAPEARQALGNGGLKRMREQFSDSAMVARMAAVYRDPISASRQEAAA